jgi:16S rRNA (uracil1498-N3)-methyltransferase
VKKPSLRALPRLFVEGATPGAPIELPKPEVDKLRKVLRLAAGAEIAVLPNDGSVLRCRFEGHHAIPLEKEEPPTEAALRLTIAQALPKGDKAEEIVRACTELGVAAFIFFPSERTVVRWTEDKLEHKMTRLATIAREAAEVSYRTRLPEILYKPSLTAALSEQAFVLAETEGLTKLLPRLDQGEATLVVGPEGGWAKPELELIGARAVTLGPRVLRVEHAAAAAAARLLIP